jgi:endonuclease III
MKNSQEYAQRLRRLYRELKRAHPKVEAISYEDPSDALVYGIIGENTTEPGAQAAIAAMRDNFVDWNDLRVSRVEEITELLTEDSPLIRRSAAAITIALRSVFDEFHSTSLVPLKKMGKRPAKQAMQKLQGVSHFALNYCMLTSLQAHAIPLTKRMVDYLRQADVVDAEADEHDIEGFLTRQVAAKDAYEFYMLVRWESESPKLAKKTKKKKTRRKTKKVAKAKK